MRPYDDEAYLEWHAKFQSMIFVYLDTEGNDEGSLREEFENAIENTTEEEE